MPSTRHPRAATRTLAARLPLPVVLVLAVFAALAVVLSSGSHDAGSAPAASRATANARLSSAAIERRRPNLAALAWQRTQRPASSAAVALRTPVARALGSAATPCGGETPGLLCTTVVVPLDRTGQTPGTVNLHVEYLPAAGTPRGAMFLVAGGPGQGSARVFGLSSLANAQYYQFLFPGYTLVAYDNRGTGASGVLRCPGLQGAFTADQQGPLVAACADTIGSSRVFYGTDEHVEDTEAVRQALGLGKIAIWGTSYGTKLAAAFAYAHADRVDRLLLDSVLPPDRDDPFRSGSLRAIPGAWADYCGGGVCRGATANAANDIVKLANALGAKPVTGKVLQANGSTRTIKITGVDFIGLVVDADLNPGLAAELPAVAKAALAGNTLPLLRAFQLDLGSSVSPAEDLSSGLFAATVCADGPFPWQPATPIAERPALVKAALDALPAGTLGQFGPYAARIGNADFCLQWPSPTGVPWLGPGPLPDVPVLSVNGSFDMRTPAAGAADMTSRFRQGRLIVVSGVGHSVLGADPSFCAARAVRAWMLGQSFSTTCARPNPYISTVPALPPPTRKTRATPLQTLGIVTRTVHDAEALWFMSFGAPGVQVAGTYGGKIISTDEGFRLQRYSIAKGIELTGTVRAIGFGPPFTFDGVVNVGGAMAASGLLGYEGGTLGGTLGGAIVGT